MTQRRYLIVALLLAALFIVACSPTADEAPPTEEPTAEQTEEAAQEEETEAPEPTAAPTEVPAPEANLTDSCVENYAEGVDYFPDKIEVENASGFSVEYHDNYKVVKTLTPWPGAEVDFTYVLVQCGTPAPEDLEGVDAVLEIPVQEAVVMSTTYLTNLDDIERLDSLVGLDAFAYTNNPAVREMIDNGELTEIAPTGQEVNVEVALELNPGMIMAFSSGAPEYDLHPALVDAGLPVVMNADWMELTPLGRAEWVKFMALFYNEEAKASDVYNNLVAEYEAAAQLAASAETQPTVLSDVPFQGTWYVPGGDSFNAQLFAAASGDYVFADSEGSGTLFLDFETVFDQAQDADIWINVFGFETLEDMLAADERFGDFKAYQEGNVYANDNRGQPGSTEIFETGVVHPHIVLKDLVKIFHPDLLPDHELYYYRQLP